MFAKTLVSRFQATCTVRAVSPFTLFLKRSKGQLKGIPVTSRSKKLAAQYHALPARELAALKAAAAKTAWPKRRAVVRKPRKAGPFAKFVKANFAGVKGTAPQRIRILAKKWQAAKK